MIVAIGRGNDERQWRSMIEVDVAIEMIGMEKMRADVVMDRLAEM
jgi:hypothetical protein